MRVRVERERTDYGYGDGWVVLDWDGGLLKRANTWARAFHLAFLIQIVRGVK